MAIISIRSIDEISRQILSECGVPNKSIEIILETIRYANRSGITTHGIGRLPLYVEKIKTGYFNPKDEVECVVDFGAVTVLDSKHGFGQVAAKHAIDIGIQKAKAFGIAAVGVRNSNNFGTAGYYGEYAAAQGMAALIFANASPAMAPTGGKKTILGTNPLCFAFPGSDSNDPIVLDMATSVVARGKIRLAMKKNEKIPLDWAIGPDGHPTDDPSQAMMGSLLPIAGYKGYGLSLFVDIFAGLLTGSAYGGDVQQLSKMDRYSNNGNLFILMDTERFDDANDIRVRVDRLYERIKSCGDEGDVLLPGEPGHIKMAEQKESVSLPDQQVQDINDLARNLGISVRLQEN